VQAFGSLVPPPYYSRNRVLFSCCRAIRNCNYGAMIPWTEHTGIAKRVLTVQKFSFDVQSNESFVFSAAVVY
jgi:hypothetical protein